VRGLATAPRLRIAGGLRRAAALAAGRAAVALAGLGVEAEVLKVLLHAAADGRQPRLRNLLQHQVHQLLQVLLLVLGADDRRAAAGVLAGDDPLQHPGGGVPTVGRGLLDAVQGVDLELLLGAAEAVGELRVAVLGVADGRGGAVDVAGRRAAAAADRDHGAQLALAGVVQHAGPSGAGHGSLLAERVTSDE
jgi:hypothetical protein